MRGIKPFRLSLLTRPFQTKSERWFGVSALAFFPFDQPGSVLTDMEMWQFLPKVLGQDLAIDAGIPKSRSEVLVTGAAFTPGGKPSATVPVRVQIGKVDKTLYVIGDRTWRRGTPSEPRPFTRMELGWESAFGGAGYAKNPRGKGFAPIKDDTGAESQALPNVELPGKLITSPKERPEPASFGPIDFSWPQRFAMAGTYDKKWMDSYYPGFAADLDWRIWNVAAADQQQELPFAVDERFVLRNLHPQHERLEGRLPNLKARCFITQQTAAEERFREVDLRLTTVWLFPEHQRGVVIFQGGVEVVEDDASDVVTLMIAGERPGEPRSLEHYRGVLAKRLDPNNLVETLNDADLMPPGAVGLAPEVERATEMTTIEGLRAKRQRAKMETKIAESRAKLTALGLDPDEHGASPLPAEPEPPSLSELPEFLTRMREEAERMKLEADAERERTLELAEEFYADVGLDFDEVKQEMVTGASGPPTFTADKQRASMRRLADDSAAIGAPSEELEHYATDPEIYAKWKTMEERLRDSYRSSAHFQSAAPRRDGLRELVVRGLEAGESFAGRDLTGADLSDLDLSGADFSDALLESADLSNATLDRARFDRAVLAHATLKGARIGGTSFREANLGKASLIALGGSEPADLRGATLWDAIVSGSDLRGANLEGVSFWGATVEDTDLTGANLARSVFHKTALARTKLIDADLTEATFMELDVSELDFAGALCHETVFLRCKAQRCNFKNGRLTNLRVVLDTDMSGSDFRGATLDKANLRGAVLRETDFSGARLNGADFSEADLSGVKAYRIVARDSTWMKANLSGGFFVSADLFGASLQKADLRGTDFRGANLYGCDFALVRSDASTNVTDAIQNKVRFLPKRPPS